MRRFAALWIGGALGMLLLLALATTPLACTQAHKPYVANPAAPLVRVRILEKQQQVNLAATEPPTVRVGADGQPRRLNIPAGANVAVQLTPQGWSIGNVPVGLGEMQITPGVDGTVSINNKRYHGKYRFVATGGGGGGGGAFDVINDVDIDSYLKGVIPEECLRHWNLETYKAQSIVARTYALYEARTSKGQYWDLHADTRSQVYGGIASENAKSRQAVDGTAGVVLVFGQPGQERIFKAYFSACCGGISMSAADAFNEPYIPPLSDQNNHSLCSPAPRFNWGPITIPKDELTQRIRAWGKNRGRPEKNLATIARVEIQAINRWGRPTRFVIIDGAGNRYSLTGEEFRWAVNTGATDGTRLNSSFVKLITEPDVVRFVDGHGHGHGVGLCQWCSEIRAQAGMRHEDIVLSAFQRAKLARAY